MKIETREDVEVVRLLLLAGLFILVLLGAYLTPSSGLFDGPDFLPDKVFVVTSDGSPVTEEGNSP